MNNRNPINRYYGNHRTAKAVYGIILITVLLVGLSHKGRSVIEIQIMLLIGAITIVFAEVYSEYLGETINKKRHLERAERRQLWSDTLAIASVSFIPSVILLLALLRITSLEAAIYISYGVLIGGLGFFGYLSSKARGQKFLRALLVGIFSGLIGLIIIVLKYKFTH